MGGTHIVFLAETEEPADLGGTLGTKTLGEDVVGEAVDLVLALLDDHEGEDGDIGADDAAADGLALALARAADAVARVTVREEETDTVGEEDTLLHGETLLVVATSNTEDISLPFVAEGVRWHLLGNLLVVEDTAERLGYFRIRWKEDLDINCTHYFFSSS